MILEKRCSKEEDFISMFVENTNVWNPIKYRSKEEMALSVWIDLVRREEKFYKKYGYLDITYNSSTKDYSRKRARGRPQAYSAKENRVTVRLSNNELRALEHYCQINNVRDKSEVIRNAIMNFIDS